MAKKQKLLSREEIRAKGTKKGVPSCQENYEVIREYYTGLEYSAAFVTNIKQELSSMYGLSRALEIIKSLKKMYIHNVQSFFTLYVGDKSRDIGTYAYKLYPDDLSQFLPKVIEIMNIRRGRGDKDIDLTSVLFYASNIMNTSRRMTDRDKAMMDCFAASTICARNNPYRMNIIHEDFMKDVAEALGLESMFNYWGVAARFLNRVNEAYNMYATKSYPEIKLVTLAYEDVRGNQLRYLTTLFGINYPKVRDTLKEIPSLSEPSLELEVALDQLKAMSDYSTTPLDYRGVFKILGNMAKGQKLFSFVQPSKLFDSFEPRKGIPRNVIKRFEITPEFYEKDLFLQQPFVEEAHIEINFSSFKSLEEARPYIDNAITLMLLRVRDHRRLKRQIANLDPNAKLLITLTEVSDYKLPFIAEVKKLEKKLRSLHNRNICLRIKYNYDTATSKFGEKEQDYIRVISDIHADVNEKENYVFDFGDDFVVNCGDTSSDCVTTRAWIRSYMRSGVAVAGNHIGYKFPFPEQNGPQNYKEWGDYVFPSNTKNSQVNALRQMFKYGSVKFLSDDIIEKQGIIFIGNTLYTDFKLFGEKNQAACMVEARRLMNDFKYCKYLEAKRYKTCKPEYFVRDYSVEHHLKQYRTCIGYITNRLKYLKNHENKKPIIIVTHFAPLPYCVADKYKNDPLSAAFANDLRDFVKEHPEIRMWCFGHVHNPCDFIYAKTRFVCEPWGYFNENNFNIKNYGKRISIKDIKSKQKWELLLEKEIQEGKVKVYKD